VLIYERSTISPPSILYVVFEDTTASPRSLPPTRTKQHTKAVRVTSQKLGKASLLIAPERWAHRGSTKSAQEGPQAQFQSRETAVAVVKLLFREIVEAVSVAVPATATKLPAARPNAMEALVDLVKSFGCDMVSSMELIEAIRQAGGLRLMVPSRRVDEDQWLSGFQ
jgi:hypothetical protein